MKNYFSVEGWKFGCKTKGKTLVLNRHDQTGVRRYIKIKKGVSIYNGELMYFAKRLSYRNSRFNRLHKFLKSQNYSCTRCEQIFKPNDTIELYHTLLECRTRSGRIQFVHGNCHDRIHSNKEPIDSEKSSVK